MYQGAEELGLSDDSDDDHDYQVPNEEYFGQKKKHDISMDSQEEEYLAPEFAIESPTSPRVPPRQESMQSSQSFDSGAGTSQVPGWCSQRKFAPIIPFPFPVLKTFLIVLHLYLLLCQESCN